jgi:DNA-binding beta-propeller fold protein YncE
VRAPAPAPFVERIPLGDGANAGRVAASPTFAYVTDGPNREVIQVLSSSRQVVRRIKLRSPPHDLGLTTDGRHLWVTLEDRRLADIDLETFEPTYVRLGIEGRYVAVTDGDVVVLSPDGDGKLQRVDPETHRTVGEPYDLGGSPTDLDAGGARAAEVTALPPQLHRFAPELGKPQTIDIETDGVPAELLLRGPDGWVTDSLYNEVVRFDAITGKALNRAKDALKPDGIADDGEGVVWVATRSGMVERLDAKTAKRSAPIDTKGPLSGDIAVVGGVAWAPGADDLVRIEPRSS